MLKQFLNVGSAATLIRYGLVAVAAWMFAGGKLDLESFGQVVTSLDKLSTILLVLIPTILGAKAAGAPKATMDGKTVAVKDLPAEAQREIREAVAEPRKKATLLEHLVGVFFRH